MTQERSTGRHAGTEPAGQSPPPVPDPNLPPAGQFPPPTTSDLSRPYAGGSMPGTDVTGPPPEHAPVGKHGSTPVRRSRFGGLWVGLIVAAVILVLLLVFILQNSQSVQIEFLWMSGQAPLAVAILLGVAAGALLVAVPGTVRIAQLRKSVRHPAE
jgi:uncharacterized integral membrane protein